MTHPTLVTALAKPGEDIKANLSPLDCEILHMLVGIAGEVGELIDPLKKAVIYRLPIDLINAVEELGDLEFYLERLRQLLGVTREQTLEANIVKLQKRFKEKQYSDQAAQERKDKI